MNLLYPDRVNDLEGLTVNLRDLETLQLVIERRKLLRKSTEKGVMLDEYVIGGGKYVLDSFAQASEISVMKNHVPVDISYLNLPNVLTKASFDELIYSEGLSYMWGSPCVIPDHNVICPCCKKRFTLKDCGKVVKFSDTLEIERSDYIGFPLTVAFEDLCFTIEPSKQVELDTFTPIRNDKHIRNGFLSDMIENRNIKGYMTPEKGYSNLEPMVSIDKYIMKKGDYICCRYNQYYHEECHMGKLSNDTRNSFINAMNMSGIKFNSHPLKVKNEYGSESYRGPWFNFKAVIGDRLGDVIIGWRKRVIELNYTGLLCPEEDITQIFNSEDVTKGRGYIHCYGEEKLVEYLKMIYEELSA